MASYWKRQNGVNLSMNFSTGSTNAFLKHVDFLSRKLIGYHAILALREVFCVYCCHNLNHSARNFLKAPAMFWDGNEFGTK